MSKQYLTESITVDCSRDVVKRTDLMESLSGGKIQVEIPVLKEGKKVMESQDMDVLGVYRVPISRPGLMNKNGRKYTLERTWNPVLDKQMGEGSLGLLNHPEAGKQPDASSVCCVWRNHKAEVGEDHNPLIKADMYLLNDKMGYGDKVESIIKAGGKVDLSTRGYGEIDENGEVYGYDFKSTDVVYEGSYSVNFDKSSRVQEGSSSQIKDPKTNSKLEADLTNNKEESSLNEDKSTGDSDMKTNKILIRKAVNEAFEKDNKFDAYSELNTIYGDLRGVEEYKDLAEDVKGKISALEEALSTAHQEAITEANDANSGDADSNNGDASNNGTADGTNKMIYPDPENKISDSDEDIPPDVHTHQIKATDDTSQDDREDGQNRPYKAAGSAKAMKDEVANGEVSHEDYYDLDDTPVYEDDEGYYVIEDNEKIYVDLYEDSDEDIPPDIHSTDVEDLDDTEDDDRSAYTDVKPASGEEIDGDKKEGGKKVESVNLYKLNKEQLIDTVLGMDEAVRDLQDQLEATEDMYEGLEDYTLRLETYTLKAERVVESEYEDKNDAREEVAEAVAFAQETQTKAAQLTEHCVEQDSYIENLEEEHYALEEATGQQAEVTPYVENLIVANPQLSTWRNELLAANTIQEARTLADKYNSNRGNVRLDKVMVNENLETVKVSLNETDTYLSKLRSRGMI